ncbi:hypothetical protein JTE90_023757 [Oedothorax gibbosus]|uniref:Uncharacterized protein n=1 Tax=Oedothorax gibbosus TaxID=931172 RepID=A0AAV6TIF1_9ARAC|nr:hypothetical protein JTE90_023757 [Oedothorax gibbosus]
MKKLKGNGYAPFIGMILCHLQNLLSASSTLMSGSYKKRIKYEDGTWLCVPKSKPKLTTDAITTIFENQPSYMTTPAPSKRKTPAERLAEQSLRFEGEFRSYLDDDRIKSFDSFKELFPGRLPDCWKKFISDDFVCLYKCDFSEDPHLSLAIKIYPD